MRKMIVPFRRVVPILVLIIALFLINGDQAMTTALASERVAKTSVNSIEMAETNAVCSPDAEGMIAYWPMDDGDNRPPVVDVIGGNDGMCSVDENRCPSSVAGIVGSAFSFGSPYRLDVPDFSEVDWPGSASFSVELWVNIPATASCTGNKVFIGRDDVFVQWWLGCGGSNGAIFHLTDSNRDSVSVQGATILNDGNWHHIVGVRDGNTGETQLYVDGQLDGSASVSFSGDFESALPLNIGYLAGSYFLPGSLDEIALYALALDAAKIASHYNAGQGQSYCNEAPQVTAPAPQNNAEGDTVSLAVTASDPDGDDLSFSANGLPPGLSISTDGVISGSLTYLAYKETPYTVTVTASDLHTPPLSSQASFTWTLTDQNRAPQVENPGDQNNAEGDNISLQISASDPDSDNTLIYSATGLPDGLVIDPGTGLISGDIGYSASPNSPYTVVVTVADDAPTPLNASTTFSWAITDVNVPPVITHPGDRINAEGDVISMQIQATDPDGDPLYFTAQHLPDGLSIDSSTGLISGVLPPNSEGEYDTLVTVSDDQDHTSTVAFSWKVVLWLGKTYLPVVIN